MTFTTASSVDRYRSTVGTTCKSSAKVLNSVLFVHVGARMFVFVCVCMWGVCVCVSSSSSSSSF